MKNLPPPHQPKPPQQSQRTLPASASTRSTRCAQMFFARLFVVEIDDDEKKTKTCISSPLTLSRVPVRAHREAAAPAAVPVGLGGKTTTALPIGCKRGRGTRRRQRGGRGYERVGAAGGDEHDGHRQRKPSCRIFFFLCACSPRDYLAAVKTWCCCTQNPKHGMKHKQLLLCVRLLPA